MTNDSQPAAPTPPATLPALSLRERRILGVLVEKAKTTPDAYPLSLNALVTGCNQKSNREPLLNLSDVEVEETLAGLQKKGLVMRITGSRVERWRHLLYESFHVGKVELAILAELFVRGPQTEGELRGRASRMEPIEDLDALRAVLKPLAERNVVVYLTPEGRRGTTLTHGFHPPEELEHLRSTSHAEPVEQSFGEPSGVSRRVLESASHDTQGMQAEITALGAELTELRERVTALTEEVRVIKEGLGM